MTVKPGIDAKPRVGISSCLLGEDVRYDGKNKRHRIIVEIVGPQVEWVPLCPEVEIGMGVPRAPVNLIGPLKSPVLLATETGEIWTEKMKIFSRQKIKILREYRLSGYIFKNSSPSCGLNKVRVYKDSSLDEWVPLGTGAFAQEFLLEFPDLPVVEEKDLATEREVALFMEKIRGYQRLQPGGSI